MELPLAIRLQVRVGIATGLTVVGELIGEGSAKNAWLSASYRIRLRGFRPQRHQIRLWSRN